jgi:hypothetical protein
MENYVILGGFKMSTVSKISKKADQPKGGYLKPSQFETTIIDDGIKLNEVENISPSLIGMAVEYLTRLEIEESAVDAFIISLKGAYSASRNGFTDALEKAEFLLLNIKKGLDDQSIINACKMTTFDVWYRNIDAALIAKGSPDYINPDSSTIQNIRTMVMRSMQLWKEYGPVIETGFTFKKDAFTQTVGIGDGDFLTKDTIWDFKVTKKDKLDKNQTLQLLMYWIIGQHDGSPKYKNIKKLGIFNPRLNIVYTLNVSQIPAEIIEAVEKDVICYEK